MTRLLIIAASLLLTSTSIAQVPGQSGQKNTLEMQTVENAFELAKEVSKPITESDIQEFLTGAELFIKWVEKDLKHLESFKGMTPQSRRAKMEEVVEASGDFATFGIVMGRLEFARSLTDKSYRAEMKQKYEEVKANLAKMDAQLAQMPPAMQEQMKAQLTMGLETMEAVANYPDSAIALFVKNQAKIDAMMERLESLDKK